MIKELTIAIILGALVGFGATTSLINSKNKNLDAVTEETSTSQPDSSSDISQDESIPTPTDHNLTITSPTPDTVVNNSGLTIKGQTSPNSILVIHIGTDTFFPEIDNTGLFSQKIELEAGVNLIQISSLSATEEQIDKEILITFTTAEF